LEFSSASDKRGISRRWIATVEAEVVDVAERADQSGDKHGKRARDG
jgi:hypothetical protein